MIQFLNIHKPTLALYAQTKAEGFEMYSLVSFEALLSQTIMTINNQSIIFVVVSFFLTPKNKNTQHIFYFSGLTSDNLVKAKSNTVGVRSSFIKLR